MEDLNKGKYVEHPGSKGGKGYWNDHGHWNYGSKPIHKTVEPVQLDSGKVFHPNNLDVDFTKDKFECHNMDLSHHDFVDIADHYTRLEKQGKLVSNVDQEKVARVFREAFRQSTILSKEYREDHLTLHAFKKDGDDILCIFKVIGHPKGQYVVAKSNNFLEKLINLSKSKPKFNIKAYSMLEMPETGVIDIKTPYGDKTLDTTYEVTYLAGYSKDFKTIYIDKRLKPVLKLKNGTLFNVYMPLVVHECEEKNDEDTRDHNYPYAHEFYGTAAERQYVESKGVNWDEYQNYVLSEVKRLKEIDVKAPLPKDYDDRPERDCHDTKELKLIKEHEKLDKGANKMGNFLDKLIKLVKSEVLEGGRAEKEGTSEKDFPKELVLEGMNHEMEHTNDPEEAKEIALDHLTEDVDYYKKLKKIEKSFLDKLLEVPTQEDHFRKATQMMDFADISFLADLGDEIAKGGVGSGKKGHTTARMPYPGENTVNQGEQQPQEKPSYVPAGGWERVPEHDSKAMTGYKIFRKWLLNAGQNWDISKFADYDPKTDKMTFKESGEELFGKMVAEAKGIKSSRDKK